MAREIEMPIPEGSLACFLDERDSEKSIVVGGFFVSKKHLLELDKYIVSVKKEFDLDEGDAIKWNLKDSHCDKARKLIEQNRVNELRIKMLSITDKIPLRIIMSYIWKGKPENLEDAWKWGFINILQRLSIIMDRKRSKEEGVDLYPALDVVFDWFPGKKKLDFYFGVYHQAFMKGFVFEKNKLPPLREFGACPCLLVSSAKYSQCLQLTDFFVGASADFFTWCFSGERKQSVKLFFSKIFGAFHHDERDGALGRGLIVHKDVRAKIARKLEEMEDCITPE